MQRLVLLLSAGAFLSGAALRVCDSLIPRLSRDFSVTVGTAARVVITFSISYGLMQLVFGTLGDRFGKARLVNIALFGCAAGAVACAVAPGFDSLVALRIVWGMAAAGVVPLSMALIGDMVQYDERQATLARMLTGLLSGMMAGQLAGGLFSDSAWGWRGAFGALAVGYTIVAIALAIHLRAHGGGGGGVAASLSFVSQLRSVLAVPWARVILLSVAIEGVFLLGPMAYLPAFLHARHGLTLAAASALIALYALGGLVYAVIAKRLVRDLGERRMVFAGGFLMGVAFFGLWISPWSLASGPLALVLGFGTYLYHNTLQTHATQMAPTVRGTAVATFASCLFVGQAIGVSLSGYGIDRLGFAPLLVIPGIVLPLAGGWLSRELASHAAEP